MSWAGCVIVCVGELLFVIVVGVSRKGISGGKTDGSDDDGGGGDQIGSKLVVIFKVKFLGIFLLEPILVNNRYNGKEFSILA